MTNEAYVLEPEHYLCYRSMVKYDRLSSLINEYYKNSDSNYIELYIDISSFIDELIKKANQVNNKVDTGDNLFISAWILNMCAHYRRFFRTRYSVDTTIFLVCRNIGNNGSEYRRVIGCVEYDRGTVSEAWVNIFKYNMGILKDLIPYIPNMEIVQTNYDFCSKSSYIMNRRNSKIPIMIISNDIMSTQLCTNSPVDVSVLLPTKHGSDDISILLGQKDVVPYYISKRKIPNAALFESDPYFYIPLMGAMSGCINRGFKSIYSISQTVSSINKLFSDGLVSPGNPTSVDRIMLLISSMFPKKAVYNKQIIDRFNCLSAAMQSLFFFNSITGDQIDITPYDGRMLHLYNPAAVKEIVSKVFTNHEIDLNNL